MAVQRALLSVFDKTGILEFAKRLAALRIEILSTGGTAKLLRDAGVAVKDVSEFTGWPEMLGGRVKTLHPKVHGGLLFRRGHAEDQKQAAEHGIAPIDVVVVNLYPFAETAAKKDLTAGELIENIDIGGPTMLRSAAKNFESVTVVTDPADYDRVAGELEAGGETSLSMRLELARKVFAATSSYDGMIATELERLLSNAGAIELGDKEAPGRGVVCSSWAIDKWGAERAGGREATARQGTFLQQFCGPGSGAKSGGGIQTACSCSDQAQQSLRSGGAGNVARRLFEGVCDRPGFGVWQRAGV
jgi:MGS-like domain/AICARFT/IMPCHase bienzyme